MAQSLPSRNRILDLLRDEGDNALHAREIATRLDVEEPSYAGLLRLLDDLTFNGLLNAQPGQHFKLAEVRQETGRRGGVTQGIERNELRALRERATREHADRERAKGAATAGEPHKPKKGERATGKAKKGLPPEAGRREAPRATSPRTEASASAAAPPFKKSMEDREGTIVLAARGFGFVASAGAPGDDVFIAPESLKGAMHGDRVRISIRGRGARGAEGEVLEVVSRTILRVAGTLRRRGKSAWIEPDDTRVRGPVVLTGQIDQDPAGNSGKDGDAAVATILRYPESPDENPEGRLEAVLGTPGEINVEVAKVLVREQVAEVHTPEAFAEAEAYGTEVPESMLEGREDLTHLPLPTIDPEDARDHDDAVWVEREGEGYIAWIAIADVSSYVRPGTRIDAEALARGCSIYLPDRAIPMLPRPLSSNLCSLLPHVIRLCLCAEVHLDRDGKPGKSRLVRGFMKSQAKLTYGGVARALGLTDQPPADPAAEALLPGLRVAQELSRKLRARRLKRGAVDFDLPEAKIILGEDGKPEAISRRASDAGTKKAYQLIEELMLLANETVAEWLVSRKLPTVFRVHAPPDPTKVVRFMTMAESLGIEVDEGVTQDPGKLSELVKSFADHPKAAVLNMLLLRSMKQATYDTVNIGHFGLASKAYLHFTSPIRRYPDLVVHRGSHAVLLNQQKRAEVEELAQAAQAASIAERRAMEIEREVVDLYRAVYMRDHIGERFVGTVTAVVGSGVFVALDEPFVDVLVRLDELGGDRYEVDDVGLRAVAERSGDVVQLGDRMEVEIIDVSILRRAIAARRVQQRDRDGTPPRARFATRSRSAKYAERNAKAPVVAEGRGKAAGKGAKPSKATPKRGKPSKTKKGRRG